MARLRVLTIVQLSIVILCGCDSSNNNLQSIHSRPLIIGAFNKPGLINPIISKVGISSSFLVSIIFNGLAKLDENMIAKPDLAESWKVSENGLVWTFNIRPEVKFHDGSPLTAEDVKFTLDVIGNSFYKNQFSHILSDIRSVDVIDDHTIQITLFRPFISLPYYLFFGILPKTVYEGENLGTSHLNYNPIGTGPYYLSSWSEDKIVLKANQDYFMGQPKIPKIIVKIFGSRRAAWTNLVSGKIDSTLLIEPETIQVIKQLSHLKIYKYIHPYYYLIVFNHRNDILKDRLIRQALNYAIDKERLIKEFMGGAGHVLSGLAYPGSTFELNKDLAYSYDPSKANELLNHAGWIDRDDDGFLEKDGQELQFSILVPGGGYFSEKVAFYVQRQLAELGIHVEVGVFNLKDLFDNYLERKQFDGILRSFVAVGDIDINYMFWSSTQQKEGLNFYGYTNKMVDHYLELGRRLTNSAERLEAYQAFQREIFQDPPGIFLFWRNIYIILPKNLHGVIVGPGAPFISIHKWYFEPEGGATQ